MSSFLQDQQYQITNSGKKVVKKGMIKRFILQFEHNLLSFYTAISTQSFEYLYAGADS